MTSFQNQSLGALRQGDVCRHTSFLGPFCDSANQALCKANGADLSIARSRPRVTRMCRTQVHAPKHAHSPTASNCDGTRAHATRPARRVRVPQWRRWAPLTSVCHPVTQPVVPVLVGVVPASRSRDRHRNGLLGTLQQSRLQACIAQEFGNAGAVLEHVARVSIRRKYTH